MRLPQHPEQRKKAAAIGTGRSPGNRFGMLRDGNKVDLVHRLQRTSSHNWRFLISAIVSIGRSGQRPSQWTISYFIEVIVASGGRQRQIANLPSRSIVAFSGMDFAA
ncbi:MAG: hypothetical protein AB3N20_21230 [Rhizobiaceae bacterium]